MEMTYLFLELLVLEYLVCPGEDCTSPGLRFFADRLFLLLLLFLFVLRHVDLEPGVVDPDFDVIGLLEQTLVQVADSVILAFVFFKVDIGLPHKLGHIEGRLIDA
jgi:hypothetical protein